ncbi:TonB-dependent receptor plug domain-containing protein [Nannocystis radixulma]|uniref:TonB-dependent receptor n=1 Tax=Nannocystis radixulma TaxID=2995305 RepID=A0ABT5AZM5_9BACT|nr:TonB-dependent receptor [Nannocystis radixulma]MDC0667294.1 TonB-dependent receptor [Nannocystis radixulma]
MRAAVAALVVIPSAAAARPPARAPGPSSPYRTVVRAGRDDGLDAQRRLDAQRPGFHTAIELAAERGARSADGLPEILARSAGATVRSLGGLGQFSALSLRGSSAQQVALFLDGVPLSSGSGGVVNLADLPLDALGAVTIYRGLVPIAYGGAALGGAVDLGSDLRCDPDPRLRAVVGAGSFASREARVGATVPLRTRSRGHARMDMSKTTSAPRHCLDLRAGYTGSAGDFRFHNIGETPLDPSDDRLDRRVNNGYDRLLTQVAFHGRAGGLRYSVQELLFFKEQGVPSMATGAQARHTRLGSLSARTVARVRRTWSKGHVEGVFGVLAEQVRFRDPVGEIGLARDDQRTRALDLYASPRGRVTAWRGAEIGLVADVRGELVGVDERAASMGGLGATGDARRRRVAGGLGLELDQRLLAGRLQLAPAVRLDVLRSRFAVPAGEGEQSDEGRDHTSVGVSPRLGARMSLRPGISLRASAGRYFRPPTLVELFGDRGYAVGNEGLRPERGTGLDAGLVVDTAPGQTSLYAHAAGFVTWSQDLIAWTQTGPYLRPTNLDRARVAGLETAAALRLLGGDLELRGNYTLLATRNGSAEPSMRGQPLPGRPRHELFVQVAAGHAYDLRGFAFAPRLGLTVEHAARTWLDPSGRFEVPARTLVGAFIELHLLGRIHLAAEVRNLLGARVATWHPPVAGSPAVTVPISDFFFFPLPGTSLWTTLRVDLQPPRRPRTTERPI